VILSGILAGLACLSLAITLWQWLAARRFPLHQRAADTSYAPGITLLKPLKGCDAETRECLRSWLLQKYAGPVQVLFGVASADDPVCEVVRELLKANPRCEAELVVCDEALGPNAKVSTLIQLQRRANHDVLIVSDADVRAPSDLLANLVAPLRDPAVGLVCSLYRLANPTTLAMQWEAIAINADFWSQVLQSRSLKPLDFALGAVMATRRDDLERIGGFEALVDDLADDYQLGHQLARAGKRIVLSPVVVECCDPPMTWRQVWAHQLRWARTIRVCQPLPYLFSIVSNATLWPLLLWCFGSLGHFSAILPLDPAFGRPSSVMLDQAPWTLPLLGTCWLLRILTALRLQARMSESTAHFRHWWLVPIKDLLAAAVWAWSFVGNHITWRGDRYRVKRHGKLVRS
jgi:ceramide glucosyltransferase